MTLVKLFRAHAVLNFIFFKNCFHMKYNFIDQTQIGTCTLTLTLILDSNIKSTNTTLSILQDDNTSPKPLRYLNYKQKECRKHWATRMLSNPPHGLQLCTQS